MVVAIRSCSCCAYVYERLAARVACSCALCTSVTPDTRPCCAVLCRSTYNSGVHSCSAVQTAPVLANGTSRWHVAPISFRWKSRDFYCGVLFIHWVLYARLYNPVLAQFRLFTHGLAGLMRPIFTHEHSTHVCFRPVHSSTFRARPATIGHALRRGRGFPEVVAGRSSRGRDGTRAIDRRTQGVGRRGQAGGGRVGGTGLQKRGGKAFWASCLETSEHIRACQLQWSAP